MCKTCVKEAPKASVYRKVLIGMVVFPWFTLVAGALTVLKAIEPFLHSMFGICTGI